SAGQPELHIPLEGRRAEPCRTVPSARLVVLHDRAHPTRYVAFDRIRNQSGSDQTRQIGGWALGALTVAHDARGPLGSAAFPLPASPERDSRPATRTPMVDPVITPQPPPAPSAAPSPLQPRSHPVLPC